MADEMEVVRLSENRERTQKDAKCLFGMVAAGYPVPTVMGFTFVGQVFDLMRVSVWNGKLQS